MNAIIRPGARGDRRDFPSAFVRALRPVLACLLASLLAWVGPATAGALYRCTGAGGETAYVSNTAGYHGCRKLEQWSTSHAPQRDAAARRLASGAAPTAAVLPGKPPHAVAANPAVLKVVPLGDDASIHVQKLVRPEVWRPLPMAVLDALGGEVLPKLLGVATPVVAVPPTVAPAPAATAAIPLKLDAPTTQPPRTGAVYRVVQKNGTVLYTNVVSLAQGSNAQKLFSYIIECYACNVHSRIDWNTVPLQLAVFGDDIRAAAKTTGVDAALLRAIIHAESNFNPRALSYKGAQGLMQLMPGTANDLGVGDAFDPAQNIGGGARYLAMLLRDFHGDVRLAAAAYNAGEGAVTKYGGVPPYAETEVYVKRVGVLYTRYRKALDGAGPALVAAKAAG